MGNKPLERGRAWIEIDLDALSYNIAGIQSIIPDECEIMAVVKANAYGHGMEKIAGKLVKDGIKAFAVATVNEGIELRNYIPDCDILVMGYTHPQDARLLNEFSLTQLLVDIVYAEELNSTGLKIHVHIAIDTGMHRLGIEPANFDEVERVFNYDNLLVKGVATHFSSPDSLDDCDIDFTRTQYEKFCDVVQKLKDKGYDVGKLHAQSSYGIYNYQEIKCDYVRPGIMMYGVKSENNDTKINTCLRPVLSLRAVIAQVRWIKAGESVSYSRLYTSEKPIKLATVCVGYADGLPRQITGNGGKCIVNGKKVPIIGRVCMDMIMLDVTDIENVKAGDIATLIGKDGDEMILSEDVAEASETITNDLLSGLGERLPRILV